MAMPLPLIPAASAIASEFLPGLIRHLAGDKAGDVARSITRAATSVTGAASPEEALEMLAGAPDKQRELRRALAELEVSLEQAALADRQDARALTRTLASEKTAIVWSAPILSAIILLSFAFMVYLVVVTPADNSSQVAQILLGALASMAVQVTNFWLGSSRSSQQKTELLAGFPVKDGKSSNTAR
jgi:hypothetical protein